MKIFNLVAILFFIMGCGSETEQETEKPSINTNPTKNLSEKDTSYTMFAYCQAPKNALDYYLHLGLGSDASKIVTSLPKNIDSSVVLDNGQEVLKLNSVRSDVGRVVSIASKSMNIHVNEKISLINKNYSNVLANKENLLLTCRYEDERYINQYFQMMVPLDNPSDWVKSTKLETDKVQFNNNLLYVNHLTDLYYKVYLKNQAYYHDKQTAIEKTEIFMRKNFDGLYYKTADLSKNISMFKTPIYHAQQVKGSMSKSYRRFYELADQKTGKKIDLLNGLIANEYENITFKDMCDEKLLCANFFRDKLSSIIQNDKFIDKFSFWQEHLKKYGNALSAKEETIESASPKDYSISMSIDFDTKDVPLSYRDLYQTIELDNHTDFSNLFFEVDSLELYGGSTSILGGVTSSGMAGYYTCFQDINKKDLGCFLIESHEDRIALNIYIGQLFDIKTSNETAILKRSGAFNYSISLDDLIEKKIPIMKDLKSDIKYIETGAIVTGVSSHYNNVCTECTANLKVDRLGIYRYND